MRWGLGTGAPTHSDYLCANGEPCPAPPLQTLQARWYLCCPLVADGSSCRSQGKVGDKVTLTSGSSRGEPGSEQHPVQSCLLGYFLKSEGSKLSLEASGWLRWGVSSLQPHYETPFVRQKRGTWALGYCCFSVPERGGPRAQASSGSGTKASNCIRRRRREEGWLGLRLSLTHLWGGLPTPSGPGGVLLPGL